MYLAYRIWNYHIIGGRYHANFTGCFDTVKGCIASARQKIAAKRRLDPNVIFPNHNSFRVQVYDIETKRRKGEWTINA